MSAESSIFEPVESGIERAPDVACELPDRDVDQGTPIEGPGLPIFVDLLVEPSQPFQELVVDGNEDLGS